MSDRVTVVGIPILNNMEGKEWFRCTGSSMYTSEKGGRVGNAIYTNKDEIGRKGLEKK